VQAQSESDNARDSTLPITSNAAFDSP